MAMSSVVSSSRLAMVSSVSEERMKCMPRNSGVCDDGVSQGGKRVARDSIAPCRIELRSSDDLPVVRRVVVAGGVQRALHERATRLSIEHQEKETILCLD